MRSWGPAACLLDSGNSWAQAVTIGLDRSCPSESIVEGMTSRVPFCTVLAGDCQLQWHYKPSTTTARVSPQQAGASSPQMAAAEPGQPAQSAAGGQPPALSPPVSHAGAPLPQSTQRAAEAEGAVAMQLEEPDGIAAQQAEPASGHTAAATTEAPVQQGLGQAALPQPLPGAPEPPQANGLADSSGHDSSGAAAGTHPGASDLHAAGE